MNVIDAIKTRRSVRAYSPRPIPTEVMARMRQALRYAPSAVNYQPWHFILVQDEAQRKQLAALCPDHGWMAVAPVTVVACALPAKAYPKMGGYFNTAHIDVAMALDHLTLAAAAEGLGTCWIGSFQEDQVKRALAIPAEARVVALMPLGYPATSDLLRPISDEQRKPESEIFSRDRWGQK